MVDRNAGPSRDWECTSHGEGVKFAVDRLVADTDPDPGYIIVIGDGAENGKDQDVNAYPPIGVESRFYEETNAETLAQNNNIKIHSVGLSEDITQDLQGINLGSKCGKVYGNPPFDNYAWRTGEQHLRDTISTPTGGEYKKVVTTQGENGIEEYFEHLFTEMATDYEIRVHERFNHDDGDTSHAYFNPLTFGPNHFGSGRTQIELLGNGCSGASDDTDRERPTQYRFWVEYDSIPQGETRCIIIHTSVHSQSPVADGLPVDYGDALDWYYVEITSGNQTWKVRLNQAFINVKSGPWLATHNGNVGSIREIDLKHPPRPGSFWGSWYLGISDETINTVTFKSMHNWLVPDYGNYGGIQLHGPEHDSNIQGGGKGGYDYYRWLWNKHPEKIQNWDKSNQLPGCSDPEGCYFVYDPGKKIPDPGESGPVTGNDYTITAAAGKKTTVPPGPEPVVFFIPGKLHINVNNASLDWNRPYIFVIGGDLLSNVSKSPFSDILCNIVPIPPDPNCTFPVTEQTGFFFINGLMSTLNPEGLTLITGSVVANGFDLRSDIGKKSPALNDILPSDYFSYDPKIIWYFRDMFGDSQTSFREVAP
jgi:hypothetical protein